MTQQHLTRVLACMDQWNAQRHEELRQAFQEVGLDKLHDAFCLLLLLLGQLERSPDPVSAALGTLGKIGVTNVYQQLAEWNGENP